MPCPDLSCPVCGDALASTASGYRCAQRHSFDRSRHGYVDLLPHGYGRSNRSGDTREMIAARRRFLDAGHYSGLRQAVCEVASAHLSAQGRAILDAGCGEGYYLEGVCSAAGDACCYGFDISAEALRAAGKRCPRCTLFRNDVTQRICLPDGSVDCVLNIFAPRNSIEFARVLSSDGVLIVVVPAPDHLSQLSDILPVGVPEDKLATTVEALPDFSLKSHMPVAFDMMLGIEAATDLVMMGPSGHHSTGAEISALLAGRGDVAIRVRASFDVLTLVHLPS